MVHWLYSMGLDWTVLPQTMMLKLNVMALNKLVQLYYQKNKKMVKINYAGIIRYKVITEIFLINYP